MTTAPFSSDISRWRRAALRGTLSLELGPFRATLGCDRPSWAALVPHLEALYPTMAASDTPRIGDQNLTVRAPNILRRYLRPQVVGLPGFDLPLVPLPQRLAPLAFEMAWNAAVALDCYRFLILHAAVVRIGDQAVIIAADTGGGKSTLAAALMEAGAILLSDEFALIDAASGNVHPFPRAISLKNESIALFAATRRHYVDTPKGTLGYMPPSRESLSVQATPARIGRLVVPHFGVGKSAQNIPIDPEKAAIRLLRGSPNYHALGEAGFTALMRLVTSAPMHELHYGSTEDGVALVHEVCQ